MRKEEKTKSFNKMNIFPEPPLHESTLQQFAVASRGVGFPHQALFKCVRSDTYWEASAQHSVPRRKDTHWYTHEGISFYNKNTLETKKTASNYCKLQIPFALFLFFSSWLEFKTIFNPTLKKRNSLFFWHVSDTVCTFKATKRMWLQKRFLKIYIDT